MVEVIIMSKGRGPLSDRALQSVLQQDFPSSEFQVRVVEQKESIHREEELLRSSADWILFLDEDCSLPKKDFLKSLKILAQENSDVAVWGGLYLSPPGSSYGVRAYNELCNFWVQLSHRDDQTQNLLGGCLALRASQVQPWLSHNPISWGGEDTYLLRKLQEQGLCSRHAEVLSVLHSPERQNFARLKNRAFLHGQHRKLFDLGTKNISLKNLGSAFKKIYYWPIWILHFVFLLKGTTIRKPAR